MANLKQIKVGSTTYDIEALHFITGSLDTPAQWKAYIDSLVGQGLQIVIDEQKSGAEEPATAASASTMGKLYLVNITGQTAGTYTEFVTVDKGSSASPRYVWEKIGTTAADLADYAKKSVAGKAGTYTSSASSAANTGSAGAGTYTTSEQAAASASGSMTGTYTVPSVPTLTGEATGSAAANTGAAGGHTINGSNFTFTGTSHSHTIATFTAGAKLDHHRYQPAGSIGGSQSVSAHSHTVNVSTASLKNLKVNTASIAAALTGVKATSTGNFNTDAYKASVNGTVLELVAAATGSAVTGVGANGTANVILNTAFTADEVTYVTGATTSTAGAHTINGNSFTFAGTTATLAHTQDAEASADYLRFVIGTYTLTLNTTQAGGSIGGSQTVADHSHSYNAPAAHSHSITAGTSNKTVTVSGSVTVGAHSHTVTIANHSHSMGHTHTVTVPNCNS